MTIHGDEEITKNITQPHKDLKSIVVLIRLINERGKLVGIILGSFGLILITIFIIHKILEKIEKRRSKLFLSHIIRFRTETQVQNIRITRGL
jgi:hypothetical protein